MQDSVAAWNFVAQEEAHELGRVFARCSSTASRCRRPHRSHGDRKQRGSSRRGSLRLDPAGSRGDGARAKGSTHEEPKQGLDAAKTKKHLTLLLVVGTSGDDGHQKAGLAALMLEEGHLLEEEEGAGHNGKGPGRRLSMAAVVVLQGGLRRHGGSSGGSSVWFLHGNEVRARSIGRRTRGERKEKRGAARRGRRGRRVSVEAG